MQDVRKASLIGLPGVQAGRHTERLVEGRIPNIIKWCLIFLGYLWSVIH